jgi:hypothetical protein
LEPHLSFCRCLLESQEGLPACDVIQILASEDVSDVVTQLMVSACRDPSAQVERHHKAVVEGEQQRKAVVVGIDLDGEHCRIVAEGSLAGEKHHMHCIQRRRMDFLVHLCRGQGPSQELETLSNISFAPYFSPILPLADCQ